MCTYIHIYMHMHIQLLTKEQQCNQSMDKLSTTETQLGNCTHTLHELECRLDAALKKLAGKEVKLAGREAELLTCEGMLPNVMKRNEFLQHEANGVLRAEKDAAEMQGKLDAALETLAGKEDELAVLSARAQQVCLSVIVLVCWFSCVVCWMQGGEDPQDALSIQVVIRKIATNFRKRAL